MDRRRFLQIAGVTGIGLAASGRFAEGILAQSPSAPPAADPVADIAAALGHDVERIFAFVRDEIRYEPYPGILRGAKGTLLARAGSSADQAVLLAELLATSAVPARFVTGSIDAAAGDQLLSMAVVDAASVAELTERAVLSPADLAAGIGPAMPPADDPLLGGAATLSPDELERVAREVAADQAAMGGVARDQLETTLERLMAALAEAGSSLPTSVSSIPEVERSEHVWVRATVGSEQVDLDSTFSTAAPGDVFGTPGDALDSLPRRLRHRVDLAVVAETFTGGVLVPETILDWGAFADELAYQGVALMFVPPASAPEVNFLGAGLSEGTRYNAVLFAGDKAHLGLRSISVGGGGGGGGLFGGALSGGGGEGIVEGETSAVWLEVRVTVPGDKPVVAQRVIFDRIGPQMRASGVIDPYAFPPAELVDLGPGAEAEYLPCRAAYALAVSGSTANIKALVEAIDYRGPGVASLLAAGWRDTLDRLRPELADRIGCMPFDDAPSVVAWTVTPTPDGVVQGMDILHRSFGTLAVAGRSPIAPPALVAGVLGQVAERVTLGDGLPSSRIRGSAPMSVSRIFELAESQGIDLRAIVGALPSDIPLDASSAASITTALEAGSIVVVPGRAVDVDGTSRTGWWVIDPTTGQAIDRLDTGAGGTSETSLLELEAAFMTQIVGISLTRVNWDVLDRIIAAYVTNGRARDILPFLQTAVHYLRNRG